MKVILLQDVPGTGKKGQVLNVSDGYARNYLFPRKWAVQASPGAVKEIERKNEIARQQEAERRAEAEQLAGKLRGQAITLRAKCGDKGRLYGSITTQEVAEALKAQHGLDLDKRKLELAETVRNLGDYEVQLTLYPGLKVPMKLSVLPVE